MTKRSLHLTQLSACLAMALSGVALANHDSQQLVNHKHQATSVAEFVRALKAQSTAHAVSTLPPITRGISSCLDDGSPGTLRSVIAAAADGDTIDLSTSGCSTITLTAGQLAVTQNGLTLIGPPVTAAGPALSIDGNRASRVILSTGTSGALEIDNITITNGYKLAADNAQANGGAIFTTNDLVLNNSAVTNSSASGYYVFGGAVLVVGNATINNSQITGNSGIAATSATSTSSQVGVVGGAIYAVNNIYLKNSTISGNSALVGTNANAATPGILAGGGIAIGYFGNSTASTIVGSTISGNYSYGRSGGIEANHYLTITNSTVSGNSAYFIGAINAYGAIVNVQNSTIAFNYGYNSTGGVYGPGSNGSITMNSTIVANNTVTSAATPSDLNAAGSVTAAGDNNLIVASDGNVAFANPQLSADPMLSPLANNGGATQTHALDPASPAVTKGNNVAGLLNDQRGFPRWDGMLTDIGAYELTNDRIFANGFE